MPEQTKRYQELAEKWLNGTITDQEAQEYAQWYNADDGLPVEIPAEVARNRSEHEARLLVGISRRIQPAVPARRPLVRLGRVAAAAAVLLLIAGGIWLWTREGKTKPGCVVAPIAKIDIPPGRNGATLHLSTGASIQLDSARNGVLAEERDVKVVKEGDALKYEGIANGTPKDIVYNEVTTSKGRQWQLTLPDGTKVWLNAASSIRYPTAFSGTDRVVAITGEVYFEVVHDTHRPFKVNVRGREVQDIGTAFNIDAYSDEPVIKTTVAEGKVRIGKQLVGAGQAALFKEGDAGLVHVTAADVDWALAWHRGLFSYQHTDLATIMRQVSRWYDVDVIYEKGVPEETFTGDISRNLSLAQVLKILEKMSAHCRIEDGHKVVITP